LSNLLQDVYFHQQWGLVSNTKHNTGNTNFTNKKHEVLSALLLTAQLTPSMHHGLKRCDNVVIFTALTQIQQCCTAFSK